MSKQRDRVMKDIKDVVFTLADISREEIWELTIIPNKLLRTVIPALTEKGHKIMVDINNCVGMSVVSLADRCLE